MASYTPSLALQGALERIKNPTQIYNKKNELVQTKYEHHVGSWACTKLKQVFSNENWAITPEQIDRYTKKKPDFVLERASLAAPSQSIPGPHVTLTLHLAMELKKPDQRIEDALVQLCESLEETVDEKGNTSGSEFEIFAVVQSGLEIGFFEFHMDRSNLDELGVSHFRGCVSLTQDYMIQGSLPVPILNKPNDLKKLYSNYVGLTKSTPVRVEAGKYTTPCIYNLEKYPQEIHDIFQYMANNKPRSSW